VAIALDDQVDGIGHHRRQLDRNPDRLRHGGFHALRWRSAKMADVKRIICQNYKQL
jgi:hypothetical protein